tara:strand:- start:4369 stop:4581 length:213 start_codon:yes stop_codon:yes gene_type:complete
MNKSPNFAFYYDPSSTTVDGWKDRLTICDGTFDEFKRNYIREHRMVYLGTARLDQHDKIDKIWSKARDIG